MPRKPATGAQLPDIATMLAGTVLISFSSVFVVMADTSPTAAAFWRTMVGGLGLAAVAAAKRSLFTGSLRDALLIVLCAALFAADLTCWHISIKAVGPGLATVLANFQVFVLAASGLLFFGERPTFRLFAAAPLAVAGLFLLVGREWGTLSELSREGVWFGLSAALFYGLYLMALRWLQRGASWPEALRNMALVSLLSAGVLALEMMGLDESFTLPGATALGWLVAYGLLAQALGWALISKSLPALAVSAGGLLILLQPTLAFVWDIWFFNRPTDMLDFMGAGLALFAIFLGITRRA